MLRAYRARWVFPVSAPPRAGEAVVVDGDRIVAIGPPPSEARVTDLGNVALLPALVNAHTHLEFSDLAKPLGRPGISFPRWIGHIIQSRGRGRAGTSRADFRQASVRQGLTETCQSGVGLVGEIATMPWSPEPFVEAAPMLASIIFLELIGLKRERVPALVEQARAHVTRSQGAAWRAGLSPHAPYSVHPELVWAIAALSEETRVPVQMHLAETHSEISLLERGKSELARFFYSRGIWQPRTFRGGRRMRDYLLPLSKAHRALVIHGNYLKEEDHTFVAEHRDRMSVVYCPRTHAFFRHARYPLAAALARGVRVALGTDSRASSPNLEMFEEIRYVARRYREVPSAEVVAMGTLRGAEALGRSDEYGSLEVGKRAALAAVPLPESESDDPHELLWLGGQARRVAVDDAN